MKNEYDKDGYFVVKNLFTKRELEELHSLLCDFHKSWTKENEEFYNQKAINSAYITGTKHLAEMQRITLFEFIGSAKLMDTVATIMSRRPTFMNTQLFFNPVNKNQKNYWHRDPQYHLSVDEQRLALSGPDVIHFRIPLLDEPGIELIPGSHKNWDTNEELQVRLETNGHRNSEDLSTGIQVELSAGDLLIFSAHMIHRGIYGMNRFALDILFCDPEASLVEHASEDCLPSRAIMTGLENADAFKSTIELKKT